MVAATQLQPPPSSASSTTADTTDVESQQINAKASHFNLILDQVGLTDAVLNYDYTGHGTADSPYLSKCIELLAIKEVAYYDLAGHSNTGRYLHQYGILWRPFIHLDTLPCLN
ncbi:hypothetical protein LB505_010305 [Fusarium chuoi]|nr:hypothetical protein LB505_010305 [Fusarium chuoi]